MAEQVTVTIQRREVLGKRVRQLRAKGIIPANIYSHGKPSRAIQIDQNELKHMLASHGGGRLIRLRLDGAEESAIVRHIEHEPRSGRIQHIDFMHVEMTEKLRARVPIRIVGESPAVRTDGGTLLHMVDGLEVECLPRDLPEALELDVSGLDHFDAALHVRDVTLPRGVTLLDNPDEPVVKVAAPRIEEEVAPAPEAAEAEAVEAGEAAETEEAEESEKAGE
ncbi:MAG TPA: 50S ribosomal protein L25 [Ktedonobacterales bacterium]